MTTTLDPSTGLAALLAAETRHVHEEAEGSSFVVRLLAGELPLEAYAALATQHLAIYTALEESAPRHRAALGHLLDPRLDRVEHLRSDLAGLGRQVVLPETVSYADRIRGVDAPGFLAHHYVRYLGDLSGGQVVRRRLHDRYGPDTPTAFYAFDGIRAKPYKDAYRAGLDALAVDRAAVAAEAVVAFRHNQAVFGALARAYAG